MATNGDILVQHLTDVPHTFLQPSLPLYTDTVSYLKHALDPLALEVSTLQQQRQQADRRKRKRGENAVNGDVLRIKQIHVLGFAPEQIWEQARRVIEAARSEAERGLLDLQARQNEQSEDDEESGDEAEDEDLGEEGVDYEVEGVDIGSEEYHSDTDMEDALDEDEMQDDFDDEDLGLDDDGVDEQPPEEFVEDKFGLNDGFFSIDDFNRRSEFLEQQDARGEDDDAESDEEDVDWGANPLSALSARTNGGDDVEQDEEEEEDGPTFGDPDAESEDEDGDIALDVGEMDGIGDMANTNEIMYTDFFAPPAQKKRPNKKGRPNPHNFPAKTAESTAQSKDAQDEDVERTVAAVHRDLFDDEDEDDVTEDDDEDEQTTKRDMSDPRSRKSTHERRKAALAEEIRKLEAANVAKREWVLSGEARAADRPLNSLLEQDLDFERTGKPVPVITAEISEDIESLIKRRILAHDFQDLIRRRPDDLATGDGRRGRLAFQLDDTKSKKSLAEEYEEEHLRRTDPNYTSAVDEKTAKEHAEIEALWNKIRTDLDGLSSWNFRPKAPLPQIEIRVDAPVVSMEDARPSAVGGGDVVTSQLAPQEVYKGGEANAGVKAEVVGKSGLPSAREELSREEKKSRRRRAKERIHKNNENQGAAEKKTNDEAKTGRKADRKSVVEDLKKGGVKVIGKKGALTDVEGNKIKSGGDGQVGGGRFKL